MTGPETLLDQALTAKRRDGRAALAIVVKTWGSSPRPAGSLLIVRADGSFDGSVSGGCIEGDVITQALEVMETGAGRLLTYAVANERAWEVGLACGGTVEVALVAVGEGLPVDLLTRWYGALSAGEPFALVLHGPAPRLEQAAPGAGQLIYLARPRTAIIGAVHIAQALAPMARQLGHEVVVIDPRTGFASAERFPDERLLTDWPDEALSHWGLTAGTAVITLTHDPKLDDPALSAALRSPAYFIAALGSRKTHAARLERLAAAGIAPETTARIHGPAGLAIGAVSPGEIAVSILAQMIAAYRQVPA